MIGEQAVRDVWQWACPLRQLRHARRWTRTVAAGELGCTSQTVYQYETGGMTPGPDRMAKMGELLQIEAIAMAQRWADWLASRPIGTPAATNSEDMIDG